MPAVRQLLDEASAARLAAVRAELAAPGRPATRRPGSAPDASRPPGEPDPSSAAGADASVSATARPVPAVLFRDGRP